MQLSIERFRSAHRTDYDLALREIRAGRKREHWIWYIFPQLRGLGRSPNSDYYGIRSREEAEEYWRDPELQAHMREILEALLAHDKPIREIMAPPDDKKLRSSMTLFLLVTGDEIFRQVLDQFFGGRIDRRTEHMLTGHKETHWQ